MSATGIEYQTFSAFHEAVKANVAPEGLAENLIAPFRSWVGYALSDIQQVIPGYRDFNVIFYEQSDINLYCNAATFQGPQGNVTQLFAFKPGYDCNRFHYQRRSQAAVECWTERQRCLCPPTTPPSSSIYMSPYCNYVINGEDSCELPYLSGEEDDCRFKSLASDDRIFSVGPDYRIHAAPRFPCGYVLCLQWQGIRKLWSNSDMVPVDNQLQEAVEHYVEHRQYMKEQQGDVSAFRAEYADSLRMLRVRFREEQEIIRRDCSTALDQLLPTFRTLYPTQGDYNVTSSDDSVRQVYTGASPPATPDDPSLPAIFYQSGGGSILQWDVGGQAWV